MKQKVRTLSGPDRRLIADMGKNGSKGESGIRRDRKVIEPHFKAESENHDFPAAATYLSLLLDSESVDRTVGRLREAPILHFMAKDILRAANLALLPPENPHVARDLEKVFKGTPLSPILLVRGDISTARGVVIADGYHRVCASYHLDENAEIPAHLADLA